MSVNLYYTQRIRGFQQHSVKYTPSSVCFTLRRTKFRCKRCGSSDLTVTPLSLRRVHGEPMGSCRELVFEFTTHRLYCPNCKVRAVEHIPFLSHPHARMTKALERTVLELRQCMSIRAVANYFHLRWHSVKELEKKHLEKKFRRIPTAHVKAVGIDEIHIGHGMANEQFLTIVRDLASGAVIHVGEGKGISALAGALKKLKKSKLNKYAEAAERIAVYLSHEPGGFTRRRQIPLKQYAGRFSGIGGCLYVQRSAENDLHACKNFLSCKYRIPSLGQTRRRDRHSGMKKHGSNNSG